MTERENFEKIFKDIGSKLFGESIWYGVPYWPESPHVYYGRYIEGLNKVQDAREKIDKGEEIDKEFLEMLLLEEYNDAALIKRGTIEEKQFNTYIKDNDILKCIKKLIKGTVSADKTYELSKALYNCDVKKCLNKDDYRYAIANRVAVLCNDRLCSTVKLREFRSVFEDLIKLRIIESYVDWTWDSRAKISEVWYKNNEYMMNQLRELPYIADIIAKEKIASHCLNLVIWYRANKLVQHDRALRGA